MGDNQKIFLCFQALAHFKQIEKAAPKNWNIQDAAKFNELLLKLAEPLQKSAEEQ